MQVKSSNDQLAEEEFRCAPVENVFKKLYYEEKKAHEETRMRLEKEIRMNRQLDYGDTEMISKLMKKIIREKIESEEFKEYVERLVKVIKSAEIELDEKEEEDQEDQAENPDSTDEPESDDESCTDEESEESEVESDYDDAVGDEEEKNAVEIDEQSSIDFFRRLEQLSRHCQGEDSAQRPPDHSNLFNFFSPFGVCPTNRVPQMNGFEIHRDFQGNFSRRQ